MQFISSNYDCKLPNKCSCSHFSTMKLAKMLNISTIIFASTQDGEEEDEEEPHEKLSVSGSVASDPGNVAQAIYAPDPSSEVFGTAVDQTEEFSDENKSIVWFLVKQVRPGMDLSRVVLPTFILEPRSFLDKLSDYHYHADILSR